MMITIQTVMLTCDGKACVAVFAMLVDRLW
jgi:hypothetical protein